VAVRAKDQRELGPPTQPLTGAPALDAMDPDLLDPKNRKREETEREREKNSERVRVGRGYERRGSLCIFSREQQTETASTVPPSPAGYATSVFLLP